jgi:hypothetical protein
LRRLLLACPQARIDNVQATEASLAARLSAIWVTGEPVVYIGLASASLTTRVGQYYRTAIGASGPHAGGWPVKMLTLDQLWVHFASCPDPESAEQQLVAAFAAGLPDDVAARLFDRNTVLPFANLMCPPRGPRKQHGIGGVRTAGSTAPGVRPTRPEVPAPPSPSEVRPVLALPGLSTQTITPVDIKNGRIRVPSPTKQAFSRDKGRVDVDLLGETSPSVDGTPDTALTRSGPEQSPSRLRSCGASYAPAHNSGSHPSRAESGSPERPSRGSPRRKLRHVLEVEDPCIVPAPANGPPSGCRPTPGQSRALHRESK